MNTEVSSNVIEWSTLPRIRDINIEIILIAYRRVGRDMPLDASGIRYI